MEEDKKYQEEFDRIRENPYEYILSWADKSLIITGRIGFKILALMPQSLFLPDIPKGSTKIRANISNLIIARPGEGKSTLCQKFALISENVISRRSITEADLIKTASELKWMTIIIEDLSQTAEEGYSVIKALEGIIGDERNVNKSTLRTEYTSEVKGVGFFGVTPDDLERFADELETGLLSRCTLTLINLSREERRKISEFIILRGGETKDSKELSLVEKTVDEFYEELLMIQRGRHEEFLLEKLGKNHNKKIIEPVKGYEISVQYKQELLSKWRKVEDSLYRQGQQPNNRDLEEYFRFLVSIAFLNFHKRKITNGILTPSYEDHMLALSLTLENARLKWGLQIALKKNARVKSVESLEAVFNDGLPQIVKEIMMNISPYAKFLKDVII